MPIQMPLTQRLVLILLRALNLKRCQKDNRTVFTSQLVKVAYDQKPLPLKQTFLDDPQALNAQLGHELPILQTFDIL